MSNQPKRNLDTSLRITKKSWFKTNPNEIKFRERKTPQYSTLKASTIEPKLFLEYRTFILKKYSMQHLTNLSKTSHDTKYWKLQKYVATRSISRQGIVYADYIEKNWQPTALLLLLPSVRECPLWSRLFRGRSQLRLGLPRGIVVSEFSFSHS